MTPPLQTYLRQFQKLAHPGPWEYEWCHYHNGLKHGFHVVFGIMVHGNEVGSLPAGLRVVEALRDGRLPFGGKVTLFIGNPEAGLEDRRFLEADLNRVFLPEAEPSHEAHRARTLMPILDQADLFIDFHQTILATEQPFYICPWQPEGWRWARLLQGASVWVTRNPNQAFSAGTRCADEYVRLNNKPGITLELSQKGFHPEAEERAWTSMKNALRTIDAIARGETSLDEAAKALPDLSFFHTVHRERFSSPSLKLRPGLTNFLPIRKGEQLADSNSEPMTAPESGCVLFPKYPERNDSGEAIHPMPNEIYRVISPLPQHPSTLWGDSTE